MLVVTTLAQSSGCDLGKDLSKEQGIVQLVKYKDTGIYLCYIYKANTMKRFTVYKVTKSQNNVERARI